MRLHTSCILPPGIEAATVCALWQGEGPGGRVYADLGRPHVARAPITRGFVRVMGTQLIIPRRARPLRRLVASVDGASVSPHEQQPASPSCAATSRSSSTVVLECARTLPTNSSGQVSTQLNSKPSIPRMIPPRPASRRARETSALARVTLSPSPRRGNSRPFSAPHPPRTLRGRPARASVALPRVTPPTQNPVEITH